jgi:arylsulfatase A-like enzyme
MWKRKYQIHMKKIIIAVLLILSLRTFGISKRDHPNIIVIFGDDIGFSDLGCYGSEISTPNLDRLAGKGMRFTQFYNGSKSEPTRNCLITGLYFGDDRALSFEGLFHKNGYKVIHSGKEHFDNWVPERCFAVNACDHAFTFWAATNFLVPPDSVFSQPLFLEGKQIHSRELEKITGKPFYMTDFITDLGLKWMDEAIQKEDPFLLVLPYNAAHWPLQALPEDIAKYRDVYRQGWDKLREARFEKMKKLGIVPANIKLSEPEDSPRGFRPGGDGYDDIRYLRTVYTPWEGLTKEQKDYFSLEMAVYAAMIDRMDQNIGRVIQMVRDRGIEDNTIIMYFSDNGACPWGPDNDLPAVVGSAGSYRGPSTSWANLDNTPFRLYKQNGHEGGSHNHFIVCWPGVIKPGEISDKPTHVVDIFPTLLDIAGISYPDKVKGEPTIPLNGSSLLPVFKGGNREDPEYIISGFTENKRMYLKGKWKLVRVPRSDWELYNLKDDPSEMNNLACKMPEKLQSMIIDYKDTKAKIDKSLKKDIRKVIYPFQKDPAFNGAAPAF